MNRLVRIGLNSAAAWLTVWLVPGLSFDGDWWWWLIFGLAIGVINSTIKPIAKLLTIPIRVVTLGLFTLVINVGLMALTIWIGLDADVGLSSESLTAMFGGALVLTVVASVLRQFAST